MDEELEEARKHRDYYAQNYVSNFSTDEQAIVALFYVLQEQNSTALVDIHAKLIAASSNNIKVCSFLFYNAYSLRVFVDQRVQRAKGR